MNPQPPKRRSGSEHSHDDITMTSLWARWHIESPASRLFTQPFIQTQIKTSKLRVTGLWAGNSAGTDEFPAQKASNAENVSFYDVITMSLRMWAHNPHSDHRVLYILITIQMYMYTRRSLLTLCGVNASVIGGLQRANIAGCVSMAWRH